MLTKHSFLLNLLASRSVGASMHQNRVFTSQSISSVARKSSMCTLMKVEMMTATAFPVRLFTMLENEDAAIIDWTSDGRAFKVIDLNRFREEILPKYYRHSKITSFQRQLNLYGFLRIHKGDDTGAYAHPMFLKGRKDMVRDIKRVSVLMCTDPTKRTKKMNLLTADHQTPSMIKLIDTDMVLPSSKNTNAYGGVKTRSIATSNLSKNIGTSATQPKKRNLFSQIDSCREMQFKSNFHQTSYPWRQVLDGEGHDAINKSSDDGDALQRRTVADSEVISDSVTEPSEYIFDFDHFFENPTKYPCINSPSFDDAMSVDDSLDFMQDDELLDLLS